MTENEFESSASLHMSILGHISIWVGVFEFMNLVNIWTSHSILKTGFLASIYILKYDKSSE